MFRQIRGKIRRFVLAHTRSGRAYIAQWEKKRRGECARCGACCRLAHRCVFLRMENGLAVCTIHAHRPANCRIFPVDLRDIGDRDAILPDRPCGYSFPADKKP